MATKAEQARYEQERTHPRKPAPKPPKKHGPKRVRTHVKTDTNLNLREDMVKGSPEQRARKAAAKRKRPRGS